MHLKTMIFSFPQPLLARPRQEKPAGTLIAMGVEKDKAQSAVRVSLDLENDMSQVEQFLTKLKLIYNQTKKVR